MEQIFIIATIWLAVAVISAVLAFHLRVSIALGLLFAPFSHKTLIFFIVCIGILTLLPTATRLLTRFYAHRTAAIRTKWILLVLFNLGAMALWAESEAVLPAYLIGMVLAGSAAKDDSWIRRLRTLTVSFLTPFYFLRAGLYFLPHHLLPKKIKPSETEKLGVEG